MGGRVCFGLVDLAPGDARGHCIDTQFRVRQTDLHEVRERGERPQVPVENRSLSMDERKKTSCMSGLRVDAVDAIDAERVRSDAVRDDVLVETDSFAVQGKRCLVSWFDEQHAHRQPTL